jgi:hypothetical protein
VRDELRLPHPLFCWVRRAHLARTAKVIARIRASCAAQNCRLHLTEVRERILMLVAVRDAGLIIAARGKTGGRGSDTNVASGEPKAAR